MKNIRVATSAVIGMAMLAISVLAVGVSPAAAQNQNLVRARGSGSVEVFGQELVCFQPPFGCLNVVVPTGEPGHFHFAVEFQAAASVPPGIVVVPSTISLHASNPETGDRIEMDMALAAYFPFSNTISFSGPCTVDGQPGSCSGSAADRGEPGDDDFFTLNYDSPTGGSGGFFGPLLSGNIEIENVAITITTP